MSEQDFVERHRNQNPVHSFNLINPSADKIQPL